MVRVAFDTSKGEAQRRGYWKSLEFPEIRSPCDDLTPWGLFGQSYPLFKATGVPHRGNKVTEVEKQTLRWVAENLDLTEKGRAFLQQQLNDGHLTDVLGEFILWILWNGIYYIVIDGICEGFLTGCKKCMQKAYESLGVTMSSSWIMDLWM